MNNIEHEYTFEIVCPYCGWKFANSSEFPDEGKEYCEDCDKEFEYARDVEVTYVTNKIEE